MRKMFHKILSLSLALLMLTGLSVTAFAADKISLGGAKFIAVDIPISFSDTTGKLNLYYTLDNVSSEYVDVVNQVKATVYFEDNDVIEVDSEGNYTLLKVGTVPLKISIPDNYENYTVKEVL